MQHREWLDSLPGAPSITAAARAAGIQKTTLMRQLDRGEIPSDNVIRLARAYGVSIPDSLVDTGYATEEEMAAGGARIAIGYMTNQVILEEMMRRTDPEATRLFHGDEDDIAPKFDNVRDFPTPGVFPLHEDESDAASTAPLEPEEGDDDYHGGP